MRSRLLVGLLSVALSSSIAVAGDAPPESAPPSVSAAEVNAALPPAAKVAKPNVRVVRVMADTQEALLLDKATNKHVVVEVGSKVGAYTVEAIEDNDVTLAAGRSQLVLSAPEHWRGSRGRGAKAAANAAGPNIEIGPTANIDIAPGANIAIGTDAGFVDENGVPVADGANVVGPTAAAPTDPYAAADEPVDPYADPAAVPTGPSARPSAAPVRAVPAPTPIVAGDDGVRVARGTADDDDFDDVPAPSMIAPPVAAAPVAAPVAAAVVTPTVLMHSELNAALSDFSKLAASVTGEFTPQGVHLQRVADGSVFAHAGLKAGDTVVAVDNTPLRTIDDAADLYSRAGATKSANIQVLRAGKPMTLRVLFN